MSPCPAVRRLLPAALLSLITAGPAAAVSIDILWYTYADPASEYRTSGVPGLAARSASDPMSSGLVWNVTFWGPTDPVPDFRAYDLLFVATSENFRTGAPGAPGAPGGPLATPDYSGILNNRAAIAAARGERTFIDGADSEFHAIRGDSGNCALLPGCALWDGAVGHVVNAVNWAASGTGLGVVASFADGWLTDPASFLHDELGGSVTVHNSSRSAENAPVISAAEAAYPLNHGLTSGGLSNWNFSFHATFAQGVPGYAEVVGSTRYPGTAVSIASSAFVGAGTAPAAVPEPPAWALLLAGLATTAIAARRVSARRRP